MSVYLSPEELKPHPKNAEIYEERADPEFEKSIFENGILEPLVVTSQNVILSGARRWKVALKIGLEKIPCRIEDPEDEVKAILEYNRYRQKTSRELYNEYQLFKEREVPKAEERMLAGKPLDPTPNLVEGSRGEVLRIAAKEFDVSHEQLRKIDYIYGHQDEQEARPIVEMLDKGEISVHQAFTEMKNTVETPKIGGGEEIPKTWKCGACLQEFELEEPVNLTICPYCAIEFQTWKAEKGLGDAGQQG